jgi:hypothetical protein
MLTKKIKKNAIEWMTRTMKNKCCIAAEGMRRRRKTFPVTIGELQFAPYAMAAWV